MLVLQHPVDNFHAPLAQNQAVGDGQLVLTSGAGAEISTTTGQVAFPANPGVTKGDQIDFGSRLLRVIGPACSRDADGVLFVVEFETTN